MSLLWNSSSNTVLAVGCGVGCVEREGSFVVGRGVGTKDSDGAVDGYSDGRIEMEGAPLGWVDIEGTFEGLSDGDDDGNADTLGSIEGCDEMVGAIDGDSEGASDWAKAPDTTKSTCAAVVRYKASRDNEKG